MLEISDGFLGEFEELWDLHSVLRQPFLHLSLQSFFLTAPRLALQPLPHIHLQYHIGAGIRFPRLLDIVFEADARPAPASDFAADKPIEVFVQAAGFEFGLDLVEEVLVGGWAAEAVVGG